MEKENLKAFLGIVFLISLFIGLSYLIQENVDFIQRYFDFGILGMFIFIIIVALSIILAPFSAVPLFPIATGLWGWIITGVLGVIGWTIGAICAFLLARRYGIRLVSKIIPLNSILQFQKRIPQGNIFLTVVFFRMITPFDGLSYILGLFSTMSLLSYSLATFLGLIPFSFFIAYLGSIPFYITVLLLLIALIILTSGIIIAHYRNIKHKNKTKK